MRIRATITLLTVLGLPVSAATRTKAVDFAANPGSEQIEVIVQFDATGKSNARSLISHGQVTKEFNHFDGVLMSLPAKTVEALSKLPGVKYVSPNRKLQRKLEYAQPATFADIAFSYGYNGAGVGVAVIDSGVTQHGDLYNGPVSRIVYSESFVPGSSVATDGYGHGSHVAGIIGGDATVSLASGSTRKFQGIAPRANIVNLRVLDNNGAGSDASVIAAIDRAIQLKATYNIRVMNLSLGRPVFESFTTDPLCLAVERAWKAGIVVVVAAGNRGRDNSAHTKGYGTIGSPGNSPYVITVGAMNDKSSNARADDRMTSFSSKGPSMVDRLVKPDLVAPGNKIVAALAGSTASLHRWPTPAASCRKATTRPTAARTLVRISASAAPAWPLRWWPARRR